MKKIALILCLTLLVSFMAPFVAIGSETIKVEQELLKEQPSRTPGVDCYELLDNPGFEILDSPEKLYAWDITSHLGKANSGLGSVIAERSEDAHSGKYSLQITVENPGKTENFAHPLCAPNLIPGEVYELSAHVKKLEDCERVVLAGSFTGTKNGVGLTYDRINMSFDDVNPSDGWVKKTVRFTCPENVGYITLLLRLQGKGKLLWDDVTLRCITDKMPEPDVDPVKEPIKFLDIQNPSFEDDVIGQATNTNFGWESMHDTKVTDKYAHSGKNSVELRVGPGQTDALVQMNLRGFEKGATYQLSGWINNPEEMKVQASYWVNYSALDTFEYDPNTRLGQTKKHWEIRKTEDWQRFVLDFTPPDGAKSALIMIRLRITQGVFYADDFSCYMVKAPNALNAETDETFYYTEWEKGYLNATPYAIADPVNSKATFSFVELDGKETHTETFDSIGDGVKYEFRTEWMKEKGKQYKIHMMVYGPDGAVLQDETFPIYRFDRPTYLGADGIFRKNGKEYTITLGNGGKIESIERNPQEGGVTVILLVGDTHVSFKERMDMAYERGLLCMINLGGSNFCAGSKDRITTTEEMVKLVKDHPALFGYKVQDEPYQKGTPDEEMMTAYEIIRNIDPHHPVYLDDSVQGCYPWLYRYSDIYDIDYYGAGDKNAGRIMSDIMDQAMEASRGRKPFLVMQQAFDNGGHRATIDELRHISYQAFFSGAQGYSFHTLHVDSNGEPFMLRPEWQEMVNGWAKWERDFMYDCFVTGKYSFVNYQKTDDILWGTFTDGTDLYAICLNREKSAPKKAEISLADGMGTVKVGDYTAVTMTGEKKTIEGNGTLSLDLAPMEAVVWKVTPSEKIDFSHLKSSKYRDILSYNWAYNAIATLEEKGIVNEMSPNWYGPGEKITRGDYAMFLVRTLGINVAAGENFADVKADAEYAKELAIGKAAGIINGVGDNKFNPEAQITRQDMMTMTSRAMQLAGGTDLSAFSDSGLIADYAASHVSAMVAEGLIRGNADGTINPLGNTTRAEAAVIMNRILNK